jgi:predicted DNA-binding transcriptional regulator AlpA
MSTQNRIMRLPDVERAVGLKRQQIWNLEAAGRFPRRFKILGSRVNGWSSGEIDAWVHERVNGPREIVGSRPVLQPRGSVRNSRASKAVAA